MKIIADSSCDLTSEWIKKTGVQLVPLTLQLGDHIFVDNHTLDIDEYMEEMGKCPTSPKTACPTPQQFFDAFQNEETVFVVTLSSELSGTYNSAMVARSMYLETHPNAFIHVFNSRSASSAESLIVIRIHELMEKNVPPQEIVDQIEKEISGMTTLFLLDSLEHLIKAGRIRPLVAKMATLFSVKPIMGATAEGAIKLVHQVRGYTHAFQKLVDSIGQTGKNLEDRILVISHANHLERAMKFLDEVKKKYNFREIVVAKMAGLSTTYSDFGGLVIAF